MTDQSREEVAQYDFQGNAIRIVSEQDGTTLFCGKDVAVALGYKRPNDALQQHCKGAAIHRPLETAGGIQQARFITEGDLYRLIANSKLPDAEKFERWVFDDVLPSIRKHGGYLTPEKIEEALLNPDTLISLATQLKNERARRAQLEATNRELAPKALFADAVAASEGSMLIREFAKELCQNGYGTGERRLYEWFRNNGYLISANSSDRNRPTQYSVERGWFEVTEHVVQAAGRDPFVSPVTRITGKGRQYFMKKLLGGVNDAA